MGQIIIAGHTCTFPQVGHAILNTYNVSPRTYELAYKTPAQPASLMIVLMLQTMYMIQALERQPFFVEDGKRTIVLLENPNKSALESLTTWLSWIIGPQFKVLCPYRLAKTNDDLQHYEIWDKHALTTDSDGKRPLLGEWPPSKTLPPYPDYNPDDLGASIHTTREYIPPRIEFRQLLF